MSGINHSANPSFEVDLSGWTFLNCTAARTKDAQPGTGQYTAKLTATGGAPIQAQHTITGLTVGARYNFSFFMKASPVSTPFTVMAFTSDTPGRANSGGAANYFVRPWVAFTAASTSVTVTISSMTNNAAGDVLYLDLVKCSDGEFAGPYFDGSYPLSTWTGTPGLSPSTCAPFVSSMWQGDVSTQAPIVANGLCLQSHAWNISQKTGRYTLPGIRGTNTRVPGMRGATFIKNKPVDTGLWTLSMWVLGCFPDGSIPQFGDARQVFDQNWATLIRHIMSVSTPITLYAWQNDGSVRTALGTVGGAMDGDIQMGGRRAEITIILEILEGAWEDYVTATTVGTPGSHWSNDTLTLTPLTGGTAPIEDAVLTVNGPCTNPVLSNPTTGTWVKYNGALNIGDTWVVDCDAWTSKVNGTSVLTSTSHFGHPRFLVLDTDPTATSPVVVMQASSTGSATNLSVTASRQHWTA